ncbi:class I SAM-dependent methyltransferase [Actinomadura macrotermitis]|uniref:Ubiquinone biosynthesis O-methyltransferase n=1 Tax=Actinomadura macrotermitis TaxID=2585200 RepID=A0A7K0BMD7_9ACTN|nr:class I SAM-dependent methyltransferase [Actinomadura macrotermitis]MQY02032.1 Ubiquinone biosynthesis O-methyltransferase [Actinomadura macrotermitis]
MRRPPPAVDGSDYWNHNTHYHGLVLAGMPRGCREALDVGCGDGLLVRKMAGRAQHVTGLDHSPEMVAKARRLSRGVPNAEFVQADFLEFEPPGDGYDFVCSVTAVHHMDFTAAITAMRAALRPGGTLVVISLANPDSFGDRLVTARGVPVHYLNRVRHRRRLGDPGAPIADPGMTWTQVRERALELLPGARFRRHALWRYSIVWHRPR